MKYTVIIASIASLLSSPSVAYIGPGAGVALIGTFFGFAAAVVASIVMILAWPAWILWKKHKAKKLAKQVGESSDSASSDA